MLGAVVTLPLRIGLQAARLATRPAVALVRHLVGDEPQDAPAPEPPRRATPPVRPRRPVRWDAPEPAAPPPPPPVVEADPGPVVEEPVVEAVVVEEHVSAEPELVADSADPDATETPGPEITVDEPWPGYRRAKAAEVIAAVPGLSREELVVAQLFESGHRRRRTVLEAIERQLKVSSPPRTS